MTNFDRVVLLGFLEDSDFDSSVTETELIADEEIGIADSLRFKRAIEALLRAASMAARHIDSSDSSTTGSSGASQ